MTDKVFDIAESVMVQYAGSEEWVFTSDELKKFAELIVEECIDCINKTDKGYIFTAQDAGVIGAAHNRSIKTIKKHFGVEE
jgi:uncharacterized protein YaiI (UPF0178 family)